MFTGTVAALAALCLQSKPSPEADVRAAAAELAAIGIAVDVTSIQAVTPEPAELRASLRSFNEDIFGESWFDTLWVTLGGSGLRVERTPEGFRMNYFRGVLRGQMAWYVASEKRVLFNSAFTQDDTGLLLAHELTHAAQDQREGISKIFARLGPTTDGLLLARCLTEGEAEAAALAVALHRKKQSLATLPAAKVAVTPEEEDDGAMRLHYALGRVFAVRAFQRGGWKAVHEALASPPANTSALAHPERRGGYAPRELELPAWPAGVGRATVARDDTWGELGLRMFLKMAGASGSEARIAAIGWRGDQLRIWKTEDGTHAFVWRLAFDRGEDARQCESVLKRKAKGRLVRRGPSIDWVVAHQDATLGALAEALAAETMPPAASEQEAKATAALEETLAQASSRVESGVWSVPTFGVRMPAPAGFEAQEMRGMHVLFAPLVDGSAFRDNIVVTASTPPDGATLESELAAVQKTLGVEPYALIRAERRKISGQDALWFEYTSAPPMGLLHHLEVQWLRSEGGKASVAVTALDSRWKDVGTVFAEVLAKLQFDVGEAK